ncbi:MAG: hypothetical protein WA885_06780 [Phormidesmis sp.]
MANPFRSFQYLPWRDLLLSAGLTVLIATAIDMLLIFGIMAAPGIGNRLLSSPLLQFVLVVAAAFGVGALAIVVTAQFFRQVYLRAESIWALLGCLLLLLFIKSLISAIPALFLSGLDYITVMTIVVGAFTKGRRYWR